MEFVIYPLAFIVAFTCIYVIDTLAKIRKHLGIDKDKK